MSPALSQETIRQLFWLIPALVLLLWALWLGSRRKLAKKLKAKGYHVFLRLKENEAANLSAKEMCAWLHAKLADQGITAHTPENEIAKGILFKLEQKEPLTPENLRLADGQCVQLVIFGDYRHEGKYDHPRHILALLIAYPNGELYPDFQPIVEDGYEAGLPRCRPRIMERLANEAAGRVLFAARLGLETPALVEHGNSHGLGPQPVSR